MKKVMLFVVMLGLSIVSLTTTVQANLQWDTFRANDNVVSLEAPINEAETELAWVLDITRDAYAMTNAIVIDGYIYIASEAENQLLKLDNKGNIVATTTMAGTIGYNGYIAYGDGSIFVCLSDTLYDESWNVMGTSTRVQAFNADTLTPIWISEELGTPGNNEVLQSPIIYHDGYVYCGTANASLTSGSYIAINTIDDDPDYTHEEKQIAWRYIPTSASSYVWSGGSIINDTIVFVSNDGELVACSLTEGTVLDMRHIGEGVSSSIAYDNGYIYFTTTSGKLITIAYTDTIYFGEQQEVIVWEGGSMTATPTVYNGNIFVGGSTDVNDFDAPGFVAVIEQETNTILYQSEVEGNVQSSLLVNTYYDDVTAYFTQNTIQGGVYSLQIKNNDMIIQEVFIPTDTLQDYCTTSIITDGVHLYHTNDSGYLMALSKDISTSITDSQPLSEDTSKTIQNIGYIIIILAFIVATIVMTVVRKTKKIVD